MKVALVGVTGVPLGKHKVRDPRLDQADKLFGEILRPVRFPRHPFLMLRFGLLALRSCLGLVAGHFREAAYTSRSMTASPA